MQFIQGEKIRVTSDGVKLYKDNGEKDDKVLKLYGHNRENYMEFYAYYNNNGKKYQSRIKSRDMKKQSIQCAFGKAIYSVLSKDMKIKPNWGTLIGVRPAKSALYLFNKNMSEKEVRSYFNQRLVNLQKTDLAIQIAKYEFEILKKFEDRTASLYISIPFCPTRCSYCSFVSSAAINNKELIEKYFSHLLEEIKYTAEIFSSLKLRLKTVYIGGGTPTTFSSQMLDKIIKTVKENFDTTSLQEFTVEAGRPDTITREKLLVLKENNVDRISVNPQTLNQKVLDKMGRRHSVEDFFKAFEMAKSIGFKSINTDIIAGLEEDTFDSFKNTVDRICTLAPENVTMHTLSLKKAANLYEKINEFHNYNEVDRMIKYFYDKMGENNYIPYYIYKQKNTLSNHENTGFAKKNKSCLYNIYMMEEFHSVFAVGAGAVTKLVTKNREKIYRIFNYKYPMEYCNDFEKVIKEKNLIREFYNEKYDGDI